MDPFNEGTIFPEAKAIKTVVETSRYPVSFTKRNSLSEAMYTGQGDGSIGVCGFRRDGNNSGSWQTNEIEGTYGSEGG